MARDRGFPTLTAQLLFYPVTRYGFETESYRQNAGGYGLTREEMIWFWRQYLKTPEDGENPRASPLLARSHENLPPALIVTAEYDPLRDEGEAYGESLRRSGVSATVVRYPGTIHGFVTMAKILPEGRDAIARAVDFLKSEVRLSPPTRRASGLYISKTGEYHQESLRKYLDKMWICLYN